MSGIGEIVCTKLAQRAAIYGRSQKFHVRYGALNRETWTSMNKETCCGNCGHSIRPSMDIFWGGIVNQFQNFIGRYCGQEFRFHLCYGIDVGLAWEKA